MKFLSRKIVQAVIDSFEGTTIFSVVFERKDGVLRRMVCRTGVQKHLKGGEQTYNGKDGDAGNIGVFDTEANGYRCFNAERVIRIRGGGFTIEACEIDEPVINARGEQVIIK